MHISRSISVPVIIWSALLATACSSDDDTVNDPLLNDAQEVEQEEANKALVERALTGFFVEGDPSYADRYIAEDYIQHNPLGMNGREFVKSIFIDNRPVDLLVEMPFYMADGEFVLQHSRFTGFTAFYERPIIAVDVYRIEDGMMVEHWDVVQQEIYPNETVSGNPMFPIIQSDEVVTEEQEKINAEMVRMAVDGIVNGDTSVIDAYFSEDYIQHSPNAANGLDALGDFSEGNLPDGFSFEIGFVMADGPYVAIHTRSAGATPVPLITFDIFRIEDDKIVEHWDVVQDEVPVEATAHGNAMFPVQ